MEILGVNSGPHAHQAHVLPLSYIPHSLELGDFIKLIQSPRIHLEAQDLQKLSDLFC